MTSRPPDDSDLASPGEQPPTVDAYLSLGSNLDDRAANLATALALLDDTPGVRLVRVSSVYETEPVGITDQPRFLNLVAKIRTDLTPEELLRACLQVERVMGRRRARRWGPRIIDVDVLLAGQARVSTDDLTVPHPHMRERQFVLVPLAEIAPELTLPTGESVLELARQTDDVRRVGKLDDLAAPDDRR